MESLKSGGEIRVLPLAALLSALAVLVACAFYFQLRLNLTNSMPRGLYRVINKPLTVGDLVEVCLPQSSNAVGLSHHYIGAGNCPGHAQALLKLIAGMAGDTVELTQDFVAVNGKRLPLSATLTQDEASYPLQAIPRGIYRLAPHTVWLMGTHDARSWDSRYYGAVSQAMIQSAVKPVLTW